MSIITAAGRDDKAGTFINDVADYLQTDGRSFIIHFRLMILPMPHAAARPFNVAAQGREWEVYANGSVHHAGRIVLAVSFGVSQICPSATAVNAPG